MSLPESIPFALGGDDVTTPLNVAPGIRDVLIDEETGDLVLTETGDLAFIRGVDGVAQACRQALRMQLGEWFLDQSVGVPWLPTADGLFTGLLDKGVNLGIARDFVRDALLAVPGVKAITTLDVTLDRIARRLAVTFVVSSDLGSTAGSVQV